MHPGILCKLCRYVRDSCDLSPLCACHAFQARFHLLSPISSNPNSAVLLCCAPLSRVYLTHFQISGHLRVGKGSDLARPQKFITVESKTVKAETQVPLSAAVRPRASYFPSLCLSFPSEKVGRIIALLPQDRLWEGNSSTHTKGLELCLACCGVWTNPPPPRLLALILLIRKVRTKPPGDAEAWGQGRGVGEGR